jgi:hypothetical protein
MMKELNFDGSMLEELQHLAHEPNPTGEDGFFTTMEMSDRLGHGPEKIARLLRKLHSAGRLEVRRVRRARIDGIVTPVPAYRVRTDPTPDQGTTDVQV